MGNSDYVSLQHTQATTGGTLEHPVSRARTQEEHFETFQFQFLPMLWGRCCCCSRTETNWTDIISCLRRFSHNLWPGPGRHLCGRCHKLIKKTWISGVVWDTVSCRAPHFGNPLTYISLMPRKRKCIFKFFANAGNPWHSYENVSHSHDLNSLTWQLQKRFSSSTPVL